MIHLLEFRGKIWEFNGSLGKPAKALRVICDSFDRSMLLHRYDLGFFHWQKHQCKDPDRLILEKLEGNRVVLMHLDLYKDGPEKIRPLLDYCESSGIDFFAPVSDGEQFHWERDSFPEHQMRIRSILEEREHICYDFRDSTDEKSFRNAVSHMIRDIKLREIL